MKQRSLLFMTVFFSICLLIFACRRDINNIINDKTEAPSVLLESAKIWHLQHVDVNDRKLSPYWKDSWMVKATDGSSQLVVPTSENYVNNKDFTIRRFFIFTASGNNIADGKIIELIGKKYNVSDNLDLLLKNYNQNDIVGFNGGILQYDIHYRQVKSAVYENGQKSNKEGSIRIESGKSRSIKSRKTQSVSTINSECDPVFPVYLNVPSGIGPDCTVTFWEETTTDNETGCVTSITDTYQSHTCPGDGTSGNGSGSGGGSGSGSGNGGGPPYGEITIVYNVIVDETVVITDPAGMPSVNPAKLRYYAILKCSANANGGGAIVESVSGMTIAVLNGSSTTYLPDGTEDTWYTTLSSNGPHLHGPFGLPTILLTWVGTKVVRHTVTKPGESPVDVIVMRDAGTTQIRSAIHP
ncbi:MAG: hypothetical protein JWR38_473 [Mucilaginibacter sp.]|nr:hypothetical protein [Mucilaginibacter sp.]